MIITDIPESVMQLSPDFEPPVEEAEYEGGLPKPDTLNEQQRAAYEEINSYVEGEKLEVYRAIALKGYAGTGKTYTCGQLVKTVIRKNKMVAITAPTNKAVKVLKSMTNFKHKLLMFKTIHSLLGLKEDIDLKTGKISFKPDFGSVSKINEVDVLIVDETSMLPDELFHMIDEHIVDGLRIVFMGDPLQIPPVGKIDCIPFTPRERTRYGIKEMELTDIIRQKGGNPILELATIVRENITKDEIPYEYKTKLTEHGGIIMINSKDKQDVFRICDHYFTNPRFTYDSDFMKVIAWTNTTVNWMNTKIRHLIFKNVLIENFKKIMVGEKLIADSPILSRDINGVTGRPDILYTTNDEFTVRDYTIETVNVFENFQVKVYRTNTISYSETGKELVKEIDIVHEDSETVYLQVKNLLKDRALKAPYDDKKQRWRIYYAIVNKFAAVKYNYAITAHKSQGSTYENCMVVDKDIDANFKTVERNRIKYVAYTRSKNLLFIVK